MCVCVLWHLPLHRSDTADTVEICVSLPVCSETLSPLHTSDTRYHTQQMLYRNMGLFLCFCVFVAHSVLYTDQLPVTRHRIYEINICVCFSFTLRRLHKSDTRYQTHVTLYNRLGKNKLRVQLLKRFSN